MLRLQLQLSGHRLALPTHLSSVRRPPDSASRLFYKKPPKFPCFGIETKPCQAALTNSPELGDKPRRTSDYQPTIWGPRLIQSIRSPYDGGDFSGDFSGRIGELKEEVRRLLREADEPLRRLELVDSIRHLGLGYHFEAEIGAALYRFHVDQGIGSLRGLRETALCFRLLREHGHHVSPDAFEKFREDGKFMTCLRQDVEGLLIMYEATHLALPGEQALDDAKEFCTEHLQRLGGDVASDLLEQVRHSLEAPLYWLIRRLESRRYIDAYAKDEERCQSLLELAKLDFNVVQALHQREIRDLSRWWEELGLVHKVDFSRDRIVENYFWANGLAFEPQFSKCRKVVAMTCSIGSVIDDFYDTYSTLEEAELFTTAIRRWDLNAMDDLPDYSKPCYLALHNLVSCTASDILKDTGLDVKALLKREMIHLCEAFLKEAQWLHRQITPSLEEYLENGWTSIGGRTLIFFALYFAGHTLTEESQDHLEHAYRLICLSSLLFRLMDDLAPSKAEMEKGNTCFAIQCRMKDSGESYEDSKEFIEDLVSRYWKELNRESLNAHLPRNFIYVAINAARACFTTFQEEDGFGSPSGIIKDRIRSLFIEPISMQ